MRRCAKAPGRPADLRPDCARDMGQELALVLGAALAARYAFTSSFVRSEIQRWTACGLENAIRA